MKTHNLLMPSVYLPIRSAQHNILTDEGELFELINETETSSYCFFFNYSFDYERNGVDIFSCFFPTSQRFYLYYNVWIAIQ